MSGLPEEKKKPSFLEYHADILKKMYWHLDQGGTYERHTPEEWRVVEVNYESSENREYSSKSRDEMFRMYEIAVQNSYIRSYDHWLNANGHIANCDGKCKISTEPNLATTGG